MAEAEYCIWLLRTLGSANKINMLIKYYGTAQDFYLAGKNDWLSSGLLNEKEIKSLSEYSPSQSYSVMKTCREHGWHILTYDSEFFPEKLREIKDGPPVLFADGNVEVLKKRPALAMVGTRQASDKACVAAYRLSMFLSRSDVLVVSGGALGIDSCAHEGALEAKCPTVAVLGCGLGHPYLSSNESMRERIKNNGVIISEMLPMAPPTRYSFPRRNRVISGMCDGVIVIEAQQKSGSLITASHAKSQQRDVFAISQQIVPSAGCKNLIEEHGAIEVKTAFDVLKRYEPLLGEKAFENKHINTPLADGNPKDSYIIKLRDMSDQRYRNEFSLPDKHTVKTNKKQERESVETPKTKKEEKTVKEVTTKIQSISSGSQTLAKKENTLPENLSEDAVKVYSVLTSDGVYPDEIQLKTNLGSPRVLAAVTELELEDLAVLLTGNKVAKV